MDDSSILKLKFQGWNKIKEILSYLSIQKTFIEFL